MPALVAAVRSVLLHLPPCTHLAKQRAFATGCSAAAPAGTLRRRLAPRLTAVLLLPLQAALLMQPALPSDAPQLPQARHGRAAPPPPLLRRALAAPRSSQPPAAALLHAWPVLQPALQHAVPARLQAHRAGRPPRPPEAARGETGSCIATHPPAPALPAAAAAGGSNLPR